MGQPTLKADGLIAPLKPELAVVEINQEEANYKKK